MAPALLAWWWWGQSGCVAQQTREAGRGAHQRAHQHPSSQTIPLPAPGGCAVLGALPLASS